jgi:dephospho-CoA kinase
MLVAHGAVLVDADQIARDVVERGTPAWSKIVDHFGRDVLAADGSIDRPKLGAIVFNDPQKLALLNEITHPDVMRRIADRLEELKGTEHVVIVDVPLLAEVGAGSMFDLIVVVTASQDAQVERMRRMRGMEESDARARIAAQLPASEKSAIADIVIVNDGSVEQLAEDVHRVWETLQAKQRGRTTQ